VTLVLGIDPGSVRLGYGLVKAAAGEIYYVECGVISASAKLSVGERLAEIGRDLEAVIAERRPDVVALEHGFVAVIRGKLQQGALISSEARGVARFLAARAGIEIADLAPATVKKSVTGHGNADKVFVAKMVTRLLRLKTAPPADAADALAAAIVIARSRRTRAELADARAAG